MGKKARRHQMRRSIGEFVWFGFLTAGYLALAHQCRALNRTTECFFYDVLAGISLAYLVFAVKCFFRHPTPKSRKRHKTSLLHKLCVYMSDLLILAFILPMGMTVVLYESTFCHHQFTPDSAVRQIEDDQGVEVIRSSFKSNMGQVLSGYFYLKRETDPRTLVILAHGNGNGHTAYMDVIEFFTKHDCCVFAYDATGYDESEGFTTRGLPQGIIDLDYAVRHVRQNEMGEGKAIVLFGHSWGGYSVCSVLNVQPDVEAVICLAGFNSSLQIIEDQGRKMLGSVVSFILPHFSLYESLKFGKYASYCALDGFANTDAKMMIVQSADDEIVPSRFGYDQYIARYGSDDRFTFVQYTDRGHGRLFDTQTAQQYLDFIQ